MRFKCLASIALCAFLLGCDPAAQIKKFVPSGVESTARGYFDLLRQGKYDQNCK